MNQKKYLNQSVSAILFDMNGTLRVIEPHEATQLAANVRILKLLGKLEGSQEFWNELTRRFQKYNQWSQENLLQLSEKEIWMDWILPDYPGKCIESVAEELSLAWKERKGRRIPVSGAHKVLIELKERGYKLGLVSNSLSSLDIPQWLNKYGWKDIFETVILSANNKKRKPDPEMFWEATRMMKVDPTQCCYIGNHTSRDGVGCKNAGFAFGIIIEFEGKPLSENKSIMIQPDIRISSLKELLEIFPVRI